MDTLHIYFLTLRLFQRNIRHEPCRVVQCQLLRNDHAIKNSWLEMAAPLLFVPTCLPSLLENGGSILAKTTSYQGLLLLSQGDFNAKVGPYRPYLSR